MTTEDNKTIVRRHFADVWNGLRPEAVTETLHPDYVGHDPNASAPIVGREGYLRATAAFRATFPDAHFALEDLIGEGDRVAVRLVLRATQHTSWRGSAATGKVVEVDGMIFYRLHEARIIASWGLFNVLGMLRQIGQPSP